MCMRPDWALLEWIKKAGSSLLTSFGLSACHSIWVLQAFNYVNKEDLGTEVPLRILFLGLHFSHGFEWLRELAVRAVCYFQ